MRNGAGTASGRHLLHVRLHSAGTLSPPLPFPWATWKRTPGSCRSRRLRSSECAARDEEPRSRSCATSLTNPERLSRSAEPPKAVARRHVPLPARPVIRIHRIHSCCVRAGPFPFSVAPRRLRRSGGASVGRARDRGGRVWCGSGRRPAAPGLVFRGLSLSHGNPLQPDALGFGELPIGRRGVPSGRHTTADSVAPGVGHGGASGPRLARKSGSAERGDETVCPRSRTVSCPALALLEMSQPPPLRTGSANRRLGRVAGAVNPESVRGSSLFLPGRKVGIR